MNVGDFGLSFLASWLANQVDDFLKPNATPTTGTQLPAIPLPTLEANEANAQRESRFKTFDAWNDLSKLLKAVNDPMLSILIEDEPSTNYRLPSMVLESRTTGEWYVFSRGRMSFEGDGGGVRNSRDILSQVKSAGAHVGVWVVPQQRLNDLDNGYEVWANVRPHAIPLMAVVAREHSWSEIESNVAKYLIET